MKGRQAFIRVGVTLVLTCALTHSGVQAADTQAIDGVWTGPWYRGMSSGKARFEIRAGGGTLELTNAERFGEGPHPLQKVSFDGTVFAFEAPGDDGPMQARLRLEPSGDWMKGMGRHGGFPVRFELERVK